MFLSRTLARRRIAAGVIPSRRAAWGLVVADIAVVSLLLALVWSPLVAALGAAPLGWMIAALFALIYVPFQIIAIIATIWAVRSRWQHQGQTE